MQFFLYKVPIDLLYIGIVAYYTNCENIKIICRTKGFRNKLGLIILLYIGTDFDIFMLMREEIPLLWGEDK